MLSLSNAKIIGCSIKTYPSISLPHSNLIWKEKTHKPYPYLEGKLTHLSVLREDSSLNIYSLPMENDNTSSDSAVQSFIK